MELKMELDNHLIDSISVSLQKITIPGYLEGLKQEMEEKHADVIKDTTASPIFYVDHVPSSMNFK
jgi:hypothetical protein